MAFIGFFTWLTVLVSCIPTWGERVTFVIISHAVAGLLNVQITLSHFSRPIFDSPTTISTTVKDENEGQGGGDYNSNNNNSKMKYGGDFYTRNVISSLDVDCPAYLDWFHGGLQFQTLHHLYPRLGREHLRKTLPLITSLCKKHNLPYTMKSFLDCNIEIYETLRNTGLEARVWSPLIYESMCAQG
jgi:delta8-fatty-acid desaturase